MPLGTGWIGTAVQQAQQARNPGSGGGIGGAVGAQPKQPMQSGYIPPTTPGGDLGVSTAGFGGGVGGPGAPGSYSKSPADRNDVGSTFGGVGGAAVGYQSALNYSNLLHGGESADLWLQRHLTTLQQDQQGARDQLQQSGLHDAYASNMARNRLGLRGVDLNRQGLGIQRGMLGLDREGLGVSRDYIANMSGLADRALEQTLGGINRNLATDQRNTTSDYTSRGAYFAPFHRADLADNYANALQARTEAAQQREGQQYGWDRDLANIGLDDRRIDLRYQDLGIADQRLNLEAERLGIDAQDYQNALNQGLAQMGLDSQLNADSLAAMLASNNVEQAALAQQILMDAMMYSGNPQIMAMLGQVFANQGG